VFPNGFGRLGVTNASVGEEIMRVLLIHNPKAGDRKHGKKQLMRSLKKTGFRRSTNQSRSEAGRNLLKNQWTSSSQPAGTERCTKLRGKSSIAGFRWRFCLLARQTISRAACFTESVDEILQSLHCGRSQPFDVGVARNGSETDYFFEAAGGGLFADYFPAAMANEKKGAGGRTHSAPGASPPVVARLSGTPLEDEHR
jgi:hypothetical protein